MVVDGGNSRWTDDIANAELLAEKRHRLRRLRRLRRRLGPGERLRPDVRRRRRRHRQGAGRLRRPQARGRLRLGPRRQGRRRPLLQDGPQRHRVRDHAGVRRGLGAARQGRAHRQRHRGLPLLARGHRHPLVAARPDGQRARRGPGPEQDRRLRRGLRRGPLDRRGRHRERRRDPRDHRRALRPLRLPPGRLADDEGRRGDAQPVRRPRRAVVGPQGRRRRGRDRRRAVRDREAGRRRRAPTRPGRARPPCTSRT